MSATQRSTWPSADLWKRIAAGGIADETECPVCGCPAAGHYRDQVAKVLFCPDPKEAEKLKVMLKRAKAPNPDVVTRERVGKDTSAWAEEGRKEAAAEVERLKSIYPDFEDLRPFINRIVTTSPDISLESAIYKARELMARNQMRENDAEIARLAAARMAEAAARNRARQLAIMEADRRYATVSAPPPPRRDIYPLDGEDGDEPDDQPPAKPEPLPSWESQLYRPYKGEEPAAPKERQTGELTKRAYNFDEE